MANIKHIEKDYKEILLGLKPEEITEYYKQLNKKLIDCLPSISFSNWNAEEQAVILANIEDVTSILKTKYPNINLTNISSRYINLLDKYLEELDLATYKIRLAKLKELASIIGLIVNGIGTFLDSIYSYYIFRIHLGKDILTLELDVPEELLEPLEPYFKNATNSSYYGVIAESFVNSFIEAEVKGVEKYIDIFRTYFSEITVPEDIPEDLASVLTEYNEVYSKVIVYIEAYEDLKVNPFKEAVERYVKYTIDKLSIYTEEDYSRLLEHELASAPSFNFETFELILPEDHVEGVVTEWST